MIASTTRPAAPIPIFLPRLIGFFGSWFPGAEKLAMDGLPPAAPDDGARVPATLNAGVPGITAMYK